MNQTDCTYTFTTRVTASVRVVWAAAEVLPFSIQIFIHFQHIPPSPLNALVAWIVPLRS